MDSIRDQVRRELRRFGDGGRLGDIVAAWPEAVGAPVAANAWPARVGRDGTLHVATSSAAWSFELSQLSPLLLERLRDALGAEAPTALRFAVGRLPELAAPAEAPVAAAAGAGAADVHRARELAAGISNEELRELVARAVAAALARAPSDGRI